MSITSSDDMDVDQKQKKNSVEKDNSVRRNPFSTIFNAEACNILEILLNAATINFFLLLVTARSDGIIKEHPKVIAD